MSTKSARLRRPAALRWVSCARDTDWATSQSRHLVRRGQDTSLCGATGSDPTVWRGNTTKPVCKTCQARFDALPPEIL
jgi:hypothetical protein